MAAVHASSIKLSKRHSACALSHTRGSSGSRSDSVALPPLRRVGVYCATTRTKCS